MKYLKKFESYNIDFDHLIGNTYPIDFDNEDHLIDFSESDIKILNSNNEIISKFSYPERGETVLGMNGYKLSFDNDGNKLEIKDSDGNVIPFFIDNINMISGAI